MVGSSAGVLMVSESLMSGSLSKSMGPAVGHSGKTEDQKERKRHKSAGDHSYLKTRSNSLLSSWRPKSQSEEKPMKYSQLIENEQSQNLLDNEEDVTEKDFLNSEMQDISEEIKDSGVGLDENEVGGDDDEFGDQSKSKLESDDSVVTADNNTESGDVTSDGGGVKQKSIDSINEIKSRSGSLKSSTSSPVHYVATPVTKDDPLGALMNPGESESVFENRSEPKSSPEKVREQFVSKKPFEDELNSKRDVGKCNSESSSNEESVRVDNSKTKVLSPVEEHYKNKFKMERTNSFPENLGNSSKGERTPQKSESLHPEVASLGRSSSSLHEARTEKSGLFRTGSFRRHKNNISGMLKFATGAVANKLSELKVSMTPSKLGSNTSLTPSCEDLDSEDESYRESVRKKGSLDFLHRSIDRLDVNSINGAHGKYS